MSQFHFDPGTYLSMIRSDVARYEELQEETARASEGVTATTILELGTGTGETAKRVLAQHGAARFIGIDRSDAMLAIARDVLPDAELLVQNLEDSLPDGPFELVFSALSPCTISTPPASAISSLALPRRSFPEDGSFLPTSSFRLTRLAQGSLLVRTSTDRTDLTISSPGSTRLGSRRE
jgi:SAM-dependent methyltransferase